jgi:hypothetical protein
VADVVEIILKLSQLREFTSGADQASKSIGGVGTAAEKTGKQAGVSWKSIAKWGGAASAAYAAQKFVRGAIDATEELGKSTLALNRTTGMNIQTSARWSAVLKTRGVSTTLFQRGLVTLSKQMQKSDEVASKSAMKVAQLTREYDQVNKVGGKKAPAALAALSKKIASASAKGADAISIWKRLGVSMEDVRKGRTEQVLLRVSDAFAKMRNPAERAALAQKLFSRSGIALAPVLFKGSKAIRDQLKLAGKYVGFNEKNAEQVKQSMADQRELKLAYMGVQVSLGKALMPAMLSATQLILGMTRAMAPLIKHGWLMKGMIIALAAAFVAYKVAVIASTIATMGLKTALLTSGIGAILLGIGVAAYLIIKHWDKVKAFFLWLFKWIKNNWPLLLAILTGPFGIAAVMIIKNWDKVRQAIFFVWNWLKRNWPYLVGILGGPFTLAAAVIYKNFGAIKKFVLGVIAAIRQAIQGLIGLVKKIPGAKTGLRIAHKIPGVGGALGKIGLQHGGTITRGGSAIVGEAGPELVTLPSAARVTPLPAAAAAGVGGVFEVRVPVYLDRRQIAEAVGRFTADKMARR